MCAKRFLGSLSSAYHFLVSMCPATEVSPLRRQEKALPLDFPHCSIVIFDFQQLSEPAVIFLFRKWKFYGNIHSTLPICFLFANQFLHFPGQWQPILKPFAVCSAVRKALPG